MLATAKVCNECGVEKPAEAFFTHHDGRRDKDFLSAACKPCTAERLRRHRAAVRERDGFDSSHVMRTYGVTVEQYNEVLARQGGACAVCQREPEEGPHRGLVVDHDHDTGVFRGLLCRSCNAGIGSLNDDPALLVAALEYLSKEE